MLEGNLVISVLKSPGPIRSDSQAACFWSASGSNNWLNNVCSSAINGYWIQVKKQLVSPTNFNPNHWSLRHCLRHLNRTQTLFIYLYPNSYLNPKLTNVTAVYCIQPPEQPTGPSHTDRIIPYMLPLGKFYNNTAHSTDTGLNLWIAGKRTLCSIEDQVFNHSTFWRNSQGIFVGEIRYKLRHPLDLSFDAPSHLYHPGLTMWPLIVGCLSSAVRFVGLKFLENSVSDLSLYYVDCGTRYYPLTFLPFYRIVSIAHHPVGLSMQHELTAISRHITTRLHHQCVLRCTASVRHPLRQRHAKGPSVQQRPAERRDAVPNHGILLREWFDLRQLCRWSASEHLCAAGLRLFVDWRSAAFGR